MSRDPEIFGDWRTDDFHTHTTWSDGEASYLEMIAAAKESGMKSLVITDHSDAAIKTIDGWKVNKLRKRQIKQYVQDPNIEVRFSVEADILNEKGALCFTYDGIKAIGVVASLHKKVYNQFGGDLNLATDAYVNTMKRFGERIAIIGHMTVPKIDLSKLDIPQIAHYMNEFEIKAEIDGKYVAKGKMNSDLCREKTRQLLEHADQVVFDSDAHTIKGLRCDREQAFEYAQSLGYFTSVTTVGRQKTK